MLQLLFFEERKRDMLSNSQLINISTLSLVGGRVQAPSRDEYARELQVFGES